MDLGLACRGHLRADLRVCELSLYGTRRCKEEMLAALIAKIEGLAGSTHYIQLSTEDLERATRGGFRRVVNALGKKRARLDTRSAHKVITIIGSHEDVTIARDILAAQDQSLEDAGAKNCAVCWTEAEKPYNTSCGHVYCTDCFVRQCEIIEEQIPVTCLGNDGHCTHVFAIDEPKSALTAPQFEHLLESSFTLQIRTQSQSFRYCPTPNCPQIFTISTTGATFTCPQCVT